MKEKKIKLVKQVKKINQVNQKNNKLYLIYIIVGSLSEILMLISLVYSSILINSISASSEKFYIYLIMTVVLLFFAIVLFYLTQKFYYSYLHKTDLVLRNALYQCLEKSNPLDFEKYNPGDIVEAATKNMEDAKTIRIDGYAKIIINAVALIFGISYMFYSSWKLSLASILVIPLVIIIQIIFTAPLEKISKKISKNKADITIFNENILKNVINVKANNIKTTLFERQNIFQQKLKKSNNKEAFLGMIFTPLVMISMLVMLCVSIGYGAYLCILDEIKVGTWMIMASVSSMTLMRFMSIPEYVMQMFKKLGSVNRYLNLLEIKEENSGNAKPLKQDTIFKLENVTYSFDEVEVLENISLSIDKADKLLIVGKSGSGKSTLIKLLLGYYDTKNISLYSQDLETIDKNYLRSTTSYVLQDSYMFSKSIQFNITLEEEVSDRNRYNKIIKLFELKEIFDKLEHYDETIFSNGVNLSGGQKQRIGIARSLYKESDIYIFDEPTSAMDNENEEMFYSILKELIQDKTIIVITHRLDYMEYFNKICVLESGKVVHLSSYQEFLESPFYAIYCKKAGEQNE